MKKGRPSPKRRTARAQPRTQRPRDTGRKSGGQAQREEPAGSQERLQKVLAAAGIGSRRQCEELIRMGRVEVDGEIVTELGTRVDPQRQTIRLDGETIQRPKLVYYAVNKPDGVVCTNRDPSGRIRVIDIVPAHAERLYTVGRLDLHSEGLILVTNDGELTQRLTHPRYGVPKRYVAQVAGEPTRDVLAQLKRGVHLAEGVARVSAVRVRRRHKQSTTLELELREGKNREIRRVLAKVGHKVMRLRRVAVGPIRLGQLKSGHWRPLLASEVQELKAAAGLAKARTPAASRKPPRSPKKR